MYLPILEIKVLFSSPRMTLSQYTDGKIESATKIPMKSTPKSRNSRTLSAIHVNYISIKTRRE